MFLLWKKIKLYVKKRLKKDNSIVKDKIISFVLELITKSKLFTGKKPPDEIIVNERLNELKDLISNKYNVKKIIIVKRE